MSRPKGTVYMIFALSFLWGFIAFSIGHSLSWGWAAGLGGILFLVGIGAHMSGLEHPFDRDVISEHKNADDWRKNWYLGERSLN